MRTAIALSVLLLVSAPANSQVRPHPGTGDPHLQFVDYSDGQIVELSSAPGFQLMVELAPDEQVQSVALGDSAAWTVSVNKDGNRLFLKPAQSGSITNMTVVTSVRTYAFDLIAANGPSSDTPYTVQFRYPATRSAASADGQFVDVSAVSRRLSRYKISGDRQLRPLSVSDDGQHTFVAWSKGSPIPAIYALDRSGSEMLVNGMMGIDDIYVVDGAPQKLIFRIDNAVARADRVALKRAR